MTIWSFEIYDKIIVRLKTIEYKIDITYYLSFWPLGLAIERSYRA